MLLVVTNSQDATADFLVEKLIAAGVQLHRIDTDTLLSSATVSFRPHEPIIRIDERTLDAREIQQIWYRRPEPLKLPEDTSPEAKFVVNEWTEAIEGFLGHVPMSRWMNHPSANAAASNKLVQLSTAASLGLRIPETLVTQSPADARAFSESCQGQVITKPMSNGYITRPDGEDSLIYTSRVDPNELADCPDLLGCPTLFQRFIQKRADVRVTVVDGDTHAVELLVADSDGQQRCDVRRDNMRDVAYAPMTLPEPVALGLHLLVRHYGLRFAAIDLAVDTEGEWYFFEVNPNGQWAWLDLVGGEDITSSFIRSFTGC
jgi:glutathione synthase/RimK-type ligase-like ATP-grasp enzyme